MKTKKSTSHLVWPTKERTKVSSNASSIDRVPILMAHKPEEVKNYHYSSEPFANNNKDIYLIAHTLKCLSSQIFEIAHMAFIESSGCTDHGKKTKIILDIFSCKIVFETVIIKKTLNAK